jgi:hypothetical protein
MGKGSWGESHADDSGWLDGGRHNGSVSDRCRQSVGSLRDSRQYVPSMEKSSFYVEDRQTRPNEFHFQSPSDALCNRLVQDLKFQMKRAVAEFPKPSRQLFIIRMIEVLADSILKIVALSNVERRLIRVEEIQPRAPWQNGR